ncbi:MAG: NADH-quinone oxidoreductase subunit F, partial [Clostridiales bacterium]|nr:NADH-quinone oxidoreductase subunit F [Clostridiales bacterium]
MRIVIGQGSCGLAAGAAQLWDALALAAGKHGLDAEFGVTGCIGMCYLEPIVEVYDGDSRRTYVRVLAKHADEFVSALKSGSGDILNRLVISDEDLAAMGKQTRIALRNCGNIDPENIEDYIASSGYEALKKALGTTPEEVIEEIKISGLAGRGGAGFPTWFKWDAARRSPGEKKYFICNADEGDPGAFMDRAVIEGDPHCLIEGMLIGAYAIGADEAIVYVRAEYPLAIKRLTLAIEQAT